MHVLAAEGGPINAVFGSFENRALWLVLGISLVALAFAYYLVREVLAAPEGTEKMKEIARAIQEGSRAYLNRQFRTVGVFILLLTVGLFFILPVPSGTVHGAMFVRFGRSLAFMLGAGFSAITGFTGMWLAVRGNVRVANAARESGLRRALRLAFRTGGVAGMFTVGLGLLGATVILMIYRSDATSVLVAEHGSWNRSVPVPPRIERVVLRPDGGSAVEPFASGWQLGAGEASRWGRPVDVAAGPDGALYLSDDGAGAIYRLVPPP